MSVCNYLLYYSVGVPCLSVAYYTYIVQALLDSGLDQLIINLSHDIFYYSLYITAKVIFLFFTDGAKWFTIVFYRKNHIYQSTYVPIELIF